MQKHLTHISDEWNEGLPIGLMFNCDPWNPRAANAGAAPFEISLHLCRPANTRNGYYGLVRTSGPYDVLGNFRITCNVNGNGLREALPAAWSYGWGYCIRRPYQVDNESVHVAAEFLRSVQRGMDKAKERHPWPASFGAYACRVMDVLGLTYGVFRADCDPVQSHLWVREANRCSYASGLDHRVESAAGFGRRIDQVLELWHDQVLQRAADQAEAVA